MLTRPADNVWCITITYNVAGQVTISPVGGPPADLVKQIIALLERKPAPIG